MSLNDLMKEINKSYGEPVFVEGDYVPSSKRIPFSSPRLNYMTYGGLPRGRIIEFAGEEGGGKAQPLYSKILTPNGYTTMGQIKLGDKVIGEDGNPYNVIGIYPQGSLPIYKLTFDDGSDTCCTGDHLWEISDDPEFKTHKTLTLYELLLNKDLRYVPLNKPVNFSSSTSEDSYYNIGMEIGSGECGNDVSIHNLPESYLINSINNRFALLLGLLNSRELDSPISDPYIHYYKTNGNQLAKDVQFLVQSLGGTATFLDLKNDYQYNLLININLIDIRNPNKVTKKIIDITSLGNDICQCIKIDNPSELYLTDNFIVTHNTTTAIDICVNAQQIFQQEYEDELATLSNIQKPSKAQKTRLDYLNEFGPRVIVYADVENTLDMEWGEKLGLDFKAIKFYKAQGQSAEEIFEDMIRVIETGEAGLVVIDSLGVMLSSQAYEKSIEQKTYGGISMPLTAFSKKANSSCRKYDCTLIGINQIRDNLNSPYGGVITTGGKAWKHVCSVRMMFKKGDFIDEDGDKINRSSEAPCGNKVMIDIAKTKSFKPDRRLGYYTLRYETGIDAISDLLDMSIANGMIEKGGSWFNFIDPETGELICDEMGETIKIQGRASVLKFLHENESILQMYENALSKIIKGVEKI